MEKEIVEDFEDGAMQKRNTGTKKEGNGQDCSKEEKQQRWKKAEAEEI